MSIVAEAPNFLQVFLDGTVKRFAPDTALASLDSSYGYVSKDVTIDPLKPISARIFLPTTTDDTRHDKLPVVVYFHGGGFCIGSTTWLGYHAFLGDLASKVRAIVVSIDYRLAPENRLPIAYVDGCTSLEWLVKNQEFEPWLNQADLSRVFLSGDSAGGNIVHNVAIEVVKGNVGLLNRVKIRGILLIHPYFGSEARSPREIIDEGAMEVQLNDMFWKLSIPEGSNRDFFGCNFEMVELDETEWGRFPNVAVFVAGLDFLMERGVMYAKFMKRKGVNNVKVIEAKEENHVFHVYHPLSEATRLLQQQMSEFINNIL